MQLSSSIEPNLREQIVGNIRKLRKRVRGWVVVVVVVGTQTQP